MNVNELLLELIKIPSISGNEKEISEFIKNYIEESGFDVEIQNVGGDRKNIVVKVGEPRLYFLAHMDTVPGEVEMKEEDGKIYGRGACDNKNCIASMLIAAKRAFDSGLSDFGLIFTVGEEDDFIGAKRIRESGIEIPFAVVGEPTGLTPIKAHYGINTFKLIARGKSVHSSDPQLGENAIQKLIQLNIEIGEKLNPEIKSPLTLAAISGGTADNVVPDCCEAIYSIRPAPGDNRNYSEEARKIVGDRAEVVETLNVPPTLNEIPDSLSFLGKGEEVKYCTELSFLKRGIVLGPGSIENAHTSSEHILVDELKNAVEVYFNIIKNFQD